MGIEDNKVHLPIQQPANTDRETWTPFLHLVLLIALCTAFMATLALVVMPLH